MNIQEREQLTRFLQQLIAAQGGPKDAEADALIRDAGNRQPDALYLLTQRAMLLDQALQNAQGEVSRLRSELAALGGGSNGFLNDNAWGNSPTRVEPRPFAPAYPTAQSTQAPAPVSWGSGALGTVATTAAGVVAGAFLFQGIEHLMGHPASGGNWFSGNGLASLPNAATDNGIINNDTNSPLDQLVADTDNSTDWL